MPSPHTISATEENCERLKVMIRQESSTHYMIPDYLTPEWQARLAAAEVSDPLPNDNDEHIPTSSSEPINESWRKKICEWCYNVVDHYEMARESVSVAMNILDRYVSSRFITPMTYTLAAVTAIHVAIKLVCSPYNLRISHLLDVCGGRFSADDIASMELTMLSALSWRVHPPTAIDFCGEFIDCSFTESDPHALNGLQEKAKYFTELAVCEYSMVTRKPSSIALASIIYAIELTDNQVDPDKDRFTSRVAQVGLDITDEEVIQCYEKLCAMYRNNFMVDEDGEAYDGELGGRGQVSPTGVGEGPDNTSKKRKRVQDVDNEGRLITENGEEIARFGPV